MACMRACAREREWDACGDEKGVVNKINISNYQVRDNICKLKIIIPPQQYKTISIAANTNVLIVIVYHSKLSTSKDVK